MGAIYLVRHGQASFGAENYDRLSETGHAQARVLGAALRPRIPEIHAVVAGTMVRHRETAEGCLAAMGQPHALRATRGFDEFDHEEVIARLDPRYADRAALASDLAQAAEPRRAFQEMFARAMARWMSGSFDAEYAEAWSAFRGRCLAAMTDVIAGLGRSKTAIVFTSGGPISVICQAALGIDETRLFELQTSLANCGVTKVLYGRGGTSIASLNEHGFFEGPGGLLTYR